MPKRDSRLDTQAATDGSGKHARSESNEAQRKRILQSLQVGNPTNRTHDLPELSDPTHECQIELGVQDIRPYEHNPRHTPNVKLDEIKESIRANGVRTPLTVTRRPGDTHFIVESGGNTRLLAIQQLWSETGDTRFEKLMVLFRPWRSESHVLTAHLVENELRGDMTFWDRATGIAALKAQIEAEHGRSLSLRQLEDELKAMGLAVNTATLAHYLFATARLRTLAESGIELSGLDVKMMQPRLNLMKRYAQMRGETGEAGLYEAVFEPVFRRRAKLSRESGRLDTAALCRECEDALAQHLGERTAKVHAVLDLLAESPQATIDALLAQADASEAKARHATPSKNAGAEAPLTVSSANSEPCGGAPKRPRCLEPLLASPCGSAAKLHERLKACIERCAGITGVVQFVKPWDAAPLGYFMEVPQVPLTDEVKRRAWWLLVLVSGQLIDQVHTQLPPESAWRRTVASATLEQADPTAAAHRDLPAAMLLDGDFFDWLLDGEDAIAATVWELLTLARAARRRMAQSEVTPNPGANSAEAS